MLKKYSSNVSLIPELLDYVCTVSLISKPSDETDTQTKYMYCTISLIPIHVVY